MNVKDLVVIHNDEPRMSTIIIADGFEREHHILIKLIEKYKTRFEKFGDFPMVTTIRGGRPSHGYLLNERQTTLLGMYLRNQNDKVLDFKDAVVEEFYRMKTAIIEAQTRQKDPIWIDTRNDGKVKRLETTSRVKEFVEYAEGQGSKNANWYYTTITKMTNAALFIVSGKFKNLRDLMTPQQLMVASAAEGIISKTLRDNMKKGIYYKEIYKLLKERLLLFADLHGQSEIMIKQLEE